MSHAPLQYNPAPEDQPEQDSAAPSLMPGRMASLFYFRTGPLIATGVSAVVVMPLLFLVFTSASLFVVDPPMDVLALWLDARALVVEPPSLDVAARSLGEGSFVYLMLVNVATLFGGTPGEALLKAQGLMAILLLLPLAYGAAMRLPLLPASALTLFILMIVMVPAQGVLSAPSMFSMAVFLWLSLVLWVRPHRSMLRCAQMEGLCAGVGLWFLYMTALPLFFAALTGVTATLVLQGRRGLVFILMAVAVFLILAACAELLSQMVLAQSLAALRFEGLGIAPITALPGLSHLLALSIIAIALLTRAANHAVITVFLLLMVLAGSAASLAFGMDPLPVLLLAAFAATFAHTSSAERHAIGSSPRPALAGVFSLSAMLFCAAGLAIVQGGASLSHQYKAQPMAETAQLGFSFAQEPHYAKLILTRQLDPVVLTQGISLSAADQALLMGEGLALAARLHSQQQKVALVSGGNLSLLAEGFLSPKETAQVVLAPRLVIDQRTDEARVSAQAVLYTQYRKAPKTEQLSPAYDLWIRQ
ncbi:hypothetical protein [Parvularcula sp. IMCC14364]|uniref:hypothetical protein n=1 Tax=Parvularcula sp. IMCC14364 TaxID=3067902 RepID=UPI00274080D1|nr:hypothetical protein [Parvularcula sp. IMCC14364]